MKTYTVAGISQKTGDLLLSLDFRAKSIVDALNKSGLALCANDIYVYRNDQIVAGPFFPSEGYLGQC